MRLNGETLEMAVLCLSLLVARYSFSQSIFTIQPSYLWNGNVAGVREDGQESYYLRQNLLYYIELNGHETIVASGGTADSDTFYYQFIETAIKNINDLMAEGTPAEDITWLVVKARYKPEDLVMGE